MYSCVWSSGMSCCVTSKSCLLSLVILCGGPCCICVFFFFQAEDGIRDLVRSRGLGDVYKRQALVPVKAGMLPVPLAPKPIAVLLFVQLYVTPATGLVNTTGAVIVPTHTVWFAG